MSLHEGAEIVLKQCMDVKKDEVVVIVTDDSKVNIGEALYKEAKKISERAILLNMPPQEVSGTEPPEPVAAAMKKADVVICPTSASLTHTEARIKAVENGARVATMPGITERMFSEGPIRADYNQVSILTDKLTVLLDKAESARIITDDKYELKLSLKGRKGVASKGVYTKKGESGNLPSGESYIAPVETDGKGKILIDGSIVGRGKLDKPVLLTLEKGSIVNIEGEKADKVNNNFPDEEEARMIGELGIGTNPKAEVTGIILEDEKIYGSIHVAFGTNTTFGGKLKTVSHIDCVTLKPTLFLDDKVIIKNGKFQEEVIN